MNPYIIELTKLVRGMIIGLPIGVLIVLSEQQISWTVYNKSKLPKNKK